MYPSVWVRRKVSQAVYVDILMLATVNEERASFAGGRPQIGVKRPKAKHRMARKPTVFVAEEMPSPIDEADMAKSRDIERSMPIGKQGRIGHASDVYTLVCLVDRSRADRCYREFRGRLMAMDRFLYSFELGLVSLDVRHARLVDESIFDSVVCRISMSGGARITIYRRIFINNGNWKLMHNRIIFGQASEVLLINRQVFIVWVIGDEKTQPLLNVTPSNAILLAKSPSDRRIIG